MTDVQTEVDEVIAAAREWRAHQRRRSTLSLLIGPSRRLADAVRDLDEAESGDTR